MWNDCGDTISKSKSRSMATVQALQILFEAQLETIGIKLPDSFDFFDFAIGVHNQIAIAKAEGWNLTQFLTACADLLKTECIAQYHKQNKQTDLFETNEMEAA